MAGSKCVGLMVTVVWASCAAGGDTWSRDFDDALAEAKRLDRPLLVHFYADWCGPCKQMERNVLHKPNVESTLGELVIPVLVNADRSPQIASRYGIDALPTDLYLEPDGTRMIESTGYKSATEYLAAARRASVRYQDLVAERRPAAPIPEATLVAKANDGPMLDGYCPVTLWKNRKWEKGSPQFQAQYKDQVYYFTSAEHQQEFEENSQRYAPRFLGCDPIVVYRSDRAVRGSTKYGAFYDDELFLFVTNENRQSFKTDPDRYIRTRVVLKLDQIETAVR